MNVVRAALMNGERQSHLLLEDDVAFFTLFGERVSAHPGTKARLQEALVVLGENFPIDASALVFNGVDVVGHPLIVHGGQGWDPPHLSDCIRRWQQGEPHPDDADHSRLEWMDGDRRCGVLLLSPRLPVDDVEPVRLILQHLLYLLRPFSREAEPGGRGKRMGVLNKLNTMLASTLQYDDILAFVLDGTRQLTSADHAELILLDIEDATLAFRHECDGNVTAFELEKACAALRSCMATRRPIRSIRGHGEQEQGASLCVPLIAGGHLLGVIISARESRDGFSQEDEDFLISFAASAANAIANARHFHELRVANADLEASHWEVVHSHHVLQALFDAITAEMYIIDSQYSLIAINAACAAATGRSQEDLLGKRCYAALAGRNQPCPGCLATQTVFRAARQEWETRRWHEAGEPSLFEMTAYPLSDPGSGNRQSLIFARDVTGKRRMEAVLRQSEKLAAVGRLATGVAHEISNPLTAMIGNAQILRRIAVEDDQVEALDMMIEAGERARQVVQNLLDLAGDDHLDLAPLDVNASIRSAVMTFQGDARFELVMDLADGLCAVGGSLEQLENLWRHLILNAGDALGERKAVILIQSEAASGGVSVRVCEYDRNIPDEDLANLFDPYASLTSTTRGQGVGLTVCRRIVKLHGGDIRVSSKPGEVTTFNVWLPGIRADSV